MRNSKNFPLSVMCKAMNLHHSVFGIGSSANVGFEKKSLGGFFSIHFCSVKCAIMYACFLLLSPTKCGICHSLHWGSDSKPWENWPDVVTWRFFWDNKPSPILTKNVRFITFLNADHRKIFFPAAARRLLWIWTSLRSELDGSSMLIMLFLWRNPDWKINYCSRLPRPDFQKTMASCQIIHDAIFHEFWETQNKSVE